MTIQQLAALQNWLTLTKSLNNFTEDELKGMLDYEFDTQKRKTFMKRIHERFCKLRSKREWGMLNGSNPPKPL